MLGTQVFISQLAQPTASTEATRTEGAPALPGEDLEPADPGLARLGSSERGQAGPRVADHPVLSSSLPSSVAWQRAGGADGAVRGLRSSREV